MEELRVKVWIWFWTSARARGSNYNFDLQCFSTPLSIFPTTWNYNLKKSSMGKRVILCHNITWPFINIVSSIQHGEETVRMRGIGAANMNILIIECVHSKLLNMHESKRQSPSQPLAYIQQFRANPIDVLYFFFFLKKREMLWIFVSSPRFT